MKISKRGLDELVFDARPYGSALYTVDDLLAYTAKYRKLVSRRP